MDDMNKAFCSIMLKNARAAAKERGIKFGKLTTWSDRIGTNRHYEVWEEGKGLVWRGNAYCATEAKAKYILSQIPDEEDDGFEPTAEDLHDYQQY